MNNLKEKAKSAFIWDFLGKIIGNGMGFIVSIFLARLLEPSEFGLIAMIMVLIGMAEIFTDIGLGAALIQRRRVLSIHYNSVFYFNISIATVLTVIIYLSASTIADFYNNVELVLLAEVMSFSFIIGAFSSLQSIKLRRDLKYNLLTKMRLYAAFISGVTGILLAFNGAGVWSLVVQNLLQGILYNIFIWKTSSWKPSIEFSFKALFQLWGFGFRMFVTGLIDKVFTQLDYLVIGKLFNAASLGYYQRAKSLNLFVIRYSSESLMSILFPVLSKIQNDLSRFQQVVVKTYGVINFITFLLLGGLYIISEELIVLLFGQKWMPSVIIFQILVLSGFVRPVGALLMNILMSRGRSEIILRMAMYKVSIALLNFVVLYIWGINAFLYGLIIVGLADLFINIFYASKEIKLPVSVFLKPFIVQFLIALFAVSCTSYVLDSAGYTMMLLFIMKGTMFTIIYLFVNYVVKTSSYHYLLEQLLPILNKRIKR